ncbi:MAG: histidine ammonia-lyase [Anaerolineaceae bacterium]
MTEPHHLVELDGRSLTFEQVLQVAFHPETVVKLASMAIPSIERAAKAVADFIDNGQVAYGITTGFGAFKDKLIPPEEVGQLQQNILLSHAVGVGNPLDQPTTRAMMLIRANTLARGHSGIRLETLELLLALLNLNILPVIPEKGSLGASGDLAPLAHMSLPLIGKGDVLWQGQTLQAVDVLAQVGLKPVTLSAKEGLALTNGTTMMTALGVLTVAKAEVIIHTANLAAALGLEAQAGTLWAYDDRLHAHRPQAFQRETATELRMLLQGTTLSRPDDPTNIQDAYTLRCVPQVHGAVHHAISYAKDVLITELNSVTDNPLLFFDDTDQVQIISGGNFHGEPLALALDFLNLALTDLGNMAERRIAKLIDSRCESCTYPPFLTEKGGTNSGFMLLQYTAAALASENKTLCHPASADSIPSSGNIEDHVSMGANSALHVREVSKNLCAILAIELMSAAQAVDFRLKRDPSAKFGQGTAKAYRIIREVVPYFPQDAYFKPYLDRLIILVEAGNFASLY